MRAKPSEMHICAKKSSGFTLVELVIGIVVFSIAMTMIVAVIMPQAKRGIDPLWQARAITLAESLLNEVNAKAFDENSITLNGRQACNVTGNSCTESANLGSDGSEERSNFDDIDDFNGLSFSAAQISNSTNNTFSSTTDELFSGFEATIEVFYDANFDGINDDDLNNDGSLDSGMLVADQKLIKIVVFTPDGEAIPFAAYRTNF